MKVTIGHTADADDAFMFYALLNEKLDAEGLIFEDTLEPITMLNAKAVRGIYDMTALSAGFLPHVSEQYDILASGACMAEEHGPMLVMRKGRTIKECAVPGLNTTAYFALRLFKHDVECHVVQFDQIWPHLKKGTIDGGVLINEDQMKVAAEEFDIIDLGAWWQGETGYPLPLGVDGVRSALPRAVKEKIGRVFKHSIIYGREHADEAIDWALRFGRGLDRETGLTFITTFVNDFSVDMGERGREALRLFMTRCHAAGLIASGNINFLP
jgi:1,4-dihydroxy-6-naphthoate synthase